MKVPKPKDWSDLLTGILCFIVLLPVFVIFLWNAFKEALRILFFEVL